MDLHGAEAATTTVQSINCLEGQDYHMSLHELGGTLLVASQQFVPDRLRKMIAKRNVGIARVSGLIQDNPD